MWMEISQNRGLALAVLKSRQCTSAYLVVTSAFRVLTEQLIIIQVVNKCKISRESECSLPCMQKLSIRPQFNRAASSSHPHKVLL